MALIEREGRFEGAGERRLTPHGVIEKYLESLGTVWSTVQAEDILAALSKGGYRVCNSYAGHGKVPLERRAAELVESADRVVVGENGQWLGDIIGAKLLSENDEVVVVLVVPEEAFFEVAGKTPR